MKAARRAGPLPLRGHASPLARRVYYLPWRHGWEPKERVMDEKRSEPQKPQPAQTAQTAQDRAGVRAGARAGDDRFYLLGLCHVDFLRPREKLILVEMLGARKVLELSLGDLRWLLGRHFTTSTWDRDAILRAAEQTEGQLTRGEVVCIFNKDSAFPPQLREIHDPPLALFVRGCIPKPGQALVGVVGTRFPTGGAERASFRLGFELAQQGVGVVSGLARGVDREAHEGCVRAGGVSVGVLGNGIDRVYPSTSEQTARRLLQAGGALVSEYPPGVPPLAYHFPARNRIINGLSRAVVVVQAPERSGALITADYALEEGRELVVHQSGLAGSAGAGTRRLCQAGAPVIGGAADLLRNLGWGESAAVAGPSRARAQKMLAGERLARIVETEMEGALVQRAGTPTGEDDG